MHSQNAHIITRCQWDTAFDSKSLAHQLQTDISAWSAYKMKRVIDAVFDSICPKGQTLKIKKLAIDLGSITYENMMSELPLRLEEALRNALYDLILYPKNGDKTLEIIHEDVAQINVLRDFLLQGILPWNYQETYGTATQIMRSQLLNYRLDVIQMIQEIGIAQDVRKRIAWQFPDDIVKKIIAGLEPNNHQQIISFSDEFVKVQEKETIVQTSTNDLKKNIWLWILNYLFTERGTIFNRVAFVRSTIQQMASHFNLSYDAMIELIEDAIERANEYSQVDKGLIAILKLLSEELRNTSFSRVKTEKQKENFWMKIETYFNVASARSSNVQKNEFNELVINLSKLDAARFQKIFLNTEQKPTVWKAILNDLIPAAIENLFLALAPSQSKLVLAQIAFLSKLHRTTTPRVSTVDLYTFGIEFCIEHQNTSTTKNAFLAFIVEKLAKQQQQTKLAILDQFVASDIHNTQKKTNFVRLFKELNTLYQKEVSSAKTFISDEALQQIIIRYITVVEQQATTSDTGKALEKTIKKWIAASPIKLWKVVHQVERTPKVEIHLLAMISSYGTSRFLKAIQPEIHTVLLKLQQILEKLISKHPKKATALRTLKNNLIAVAFEVVWKHPKTTASNFFAALLQQISHSKNTASISKTDLKAVIELLLQTRKIRTLSWTAREFVSIQKQYQLNITTTEEAEILTLLETTQQQAIVAKRLAKLVRAKKIHTSEFKANEARFVSYLVSNGTQLQKHWIEKFVKLITAGKSNYSAAKIKTIVHELFWQTLVAYQQHRGNANTFVKLFEKTVVSVFPNITTQKNTASKLKAFKNIILSEANNSEEIAQNVPNNALKNSTTSIAASSNLDAQTKVLVTPYQISVIALFEALRSNLKTTTQHLEIANKTYSFAKLFAIGLETSPVTIRTILEEVASNDTQISFLSEHIKFEEFITFHANDTSSAHRKFFKAIHVIYMLAKQLGNTQILAALQSVFWKKTIALIQGKGAKKKLLAQLINTTFDKLSDIATLDQITIVKHIQNKHIQVPKVLKSVLIKRHRIFELVSESVEKNTLSATIQHYIDSQKIDELIHYLITEFEIPTWFQHTTSYTYEQIVNELLQQQPLQVLQAIRSPHISEIQLLKFVQTVHFDTFITSLAKRYTAQQQELSNIRKLYENSAFTSMRGISTKSLQELIVKKVITAWRTSNWSLIASMNIWNELLWEASKKGVQEQDFFAAINTVKTMLPTALIVTYKSTVANSKAAVKAPQELSVKSINELPMNEPTNTIPDEGISIPNAGMVLLNSYFLMLLERLGAVKDNAFVSDEAQLDAVHYLQFIVTGMTETDETLLTLNKILVGLSPNTPVKNSVEMTPAQKDLIDGMINAAINYWPSIGQTSVNGFRGNWLVREGILRETEDRWELTVEKRPYDVLMIKSPFSFSIIKLPWMTKPLHVTWPF
jgi:hypothetical protein